ncbi:MAG: M48 family metalloprotease, partial [Armatimonadota bacterium]
MFGSGVSLAQPPSEDPEIKIGREAHEEMLKSGMKLISDPQLLGRVNAIGSRLAAVANKTVIPATYGTENRTPYTYRFHVVDDKDVNAFALPGGWLYVNKGLLEYVQSDDELAGVLAHEVIHAAHHHILKLQKEQDKLNTQLAIGAIAAILAKVPATDTGNLVTGLQLVALQKVNGYSQQAERDADGAGFELTRLAGFNPVGALTFMERLARDQRNRPEVDLGIFRTHPPEKQRVAALKGKLDAAAISINRRQTTNQLRVTVVPAKNQTVIHELQVDTRVVLTSPDKTYLAQIASLLDKALDSPTELFDVTRTGSSVLIRGMLLFTVRSSDIKLGQNPEN